MTQPPMTFRLLEEDEDAPPPYEATTPATTVSHRTSEAAQHQQYPALDNYNRSNDISMSRPSMAYYPQMTTAGDSTVAPLVYSPYPDVADPALYDNHTSPTAPWNPQVYPSTTIHPPNAPWVFPDESEDAFVGSKPAMVEPTMSLGGYDMMGHGSGPVQAVQADQGDFTSQGYISSFSSHFLPESSSSPAPVSPELVINYKCGRCGAKLESETAVCKRIHVLSTMMAERQILQATNADLQERKRGQNGIGSSSAGAHTSGDMESITDPESNSGLLLEGDAPSSSSTQWSSRNEDHTSAYPIPASSPHGTPENNYGANASYFRRSLSVQAPLTALRKFFRDAKKELDYQKSGRQSSSWQHEFVRPSPPTVGSEVYENDGSAGGLGRSNTHGGSYAPASYSSDAPKYAQPEPALVAPPTMRRQMSSSAPPRPPVWE